MKQSQNDRFHAKMKMMKSQYFCIFMYIWWVLNFFFGVSLSNHAAMPKLSNWSASKAWQLLLKKLKLLTKRPPVATTVPSGMNTVIGALIYRVYLRIYDSGLSNPTTFLGLCRNQKLLLLSFVVTDSMVSPDIWPTSKYFKWINTLSREVYIRPQATQQPY